MMPIKLNDEPWPDDRAMVQNIQEQEGGATCPDCGLPLPESITWEAGTSMFVFEDRRGRCTCERCIRCRGQMSPQDKKWAIKGVHPDAWKCVLGLEARVKGLETVTYCSYCGQEFPLDEPPCPLCVDGPHDDHQEQSYEGTAVEQVTQHIWECQQHPMWQLQERVQELEAAEENRREDWLSRKGDG